MVTRVLIPVDGSEQAELAAELAFDLFPDGQFTLLHVIDPTEAGFSLEATIPSFPEDWYEKQQAGAEECFDDLEALAGGTDLDTERVIEVGKPVRTIMETVDEADIDHIVMGSTGRQGVSRLLLGSVAENVIRRSPVPVTIAREQEALADDES
jgi:nucleotide-binding universal stress UspA family protein